LGSFIYSPEEGTPGASYPDQVDPSVARERLERVMALQEEISLQHQEALVGKDLEVVVEQREGDLLLGRSYREAPEVDGQIEIKLPQERPPFGSRVKVRITEALEHDLRGEIL
jgi:ribosomal protein S12 methylthiotransferase